MGALATAAASRPRADRERQERLKKKAERIQRVRPVRFECASRGAAFSPFRQAAGEKPAAVDVRLWAGLFRQPSVAAAWPLGRA